MKLCLPKDLKVGDRVQAQGHAACGLDPCINEVGVCMRCLWKVKEACDAAVRRTAVLNSLLSHVDPGPRVNWLRGHRAAHVPVLRRGRDGHRRSRPRRNVPTSQLPPLCLMMRDGLCLGGLRPLRCAHAFSRDQVVCQNELI